mmetsp:Transcript_8701/g.18755  ORF Transcript_8701/g.18755 Transcript_8701/m.18755 type:complete len:98 (-) Transcript_8701:649-942(-)
MHPRQMVCQLIDSSPNCAKIGSTKCVVVVSYIHMAPKWWVIHLILPPLISSKGLSKPISTSQSIHHIISIQAQIATIIKKCLEYEVDRHTAIKYLAK